MPIKIPNDLPASKILKEENIFVMDETRALSQRIRPLKLIIVNIMPTKIVTETQLLRLLSNTPLQIEVDWLCMESHNSKNTPQEHLMEFYKTFNEIKDNKYDGLIVTGAPVEKLKFEDVDYWDELTKIFDWANTNVFSSFFICWASQASLYYYYGVEKYQLKEKLTGVYHHHTNPEKMRRRILRGFDYQFYAPHSRYTSVKKEDIENLAVGDKITFHEEGAAWNQVVNNAVTSIEKNDEYHLVSINGGIEQPGGLDLKLEDDDTYRTMTFDDYPLYYEMGEKTMPLADDAVLKDSSADPQAEAVETTGADAVAAAINADPGNWTTYNTTLVVQGGKVLEVRRIWVP